MEARLKYMDNKSRSFVPGIKLFPLTHVKVPIFEAGLFYQKTNCQIDNMTDITITEIGFDIEFTWISDTILHNRCTKFL